jgi:hypothetical protein
MSKHPAPSEPESVFAAMRRQIAITPLPAPRRLTVRERLSQHPRVAISGASAVLAVGVAAIMLVATGSLTNAPPAFAITVTRHSVVIKLRDFDALGDLNATLAAEQIPVRAVPVVPGCTATANLVAAQGTIRRTIRAGSASGPGAIHVDVTHHPPPGDLLIVAEARRGHALLLPQLIHGPAPSCIAAGPGPPLSPAKAAP